MVSHNRKSSCPEQEGNSSNSSSGKIPVQESKWRHGGHHNPRQASISGLRNVINSLLMSDHSSYLVESFLRKVVREEVEHKFQDHLSSIARVDHAEISGAKPLQLCFIKKLPATIYTLSNIIAEDESPLQLALFDVRSKSLVIDGPFSSIKVEICALNGEFGSNGSEDWTEGEFNANILRERDGKGPLLTGDKFVTLKNGVACISKITLTDNSRWLRSRKFRLGAKVVQPTSSGVNIKEGRSEPFVVKDNRGELYKKHYPPSLNDDIWRLEKIAKDGKLYERLALQGIRTVRDLLQLYSINQYSLYEMCGNIPRKSWTAITEHAKTCTIDDHKLYSYQTAELPVVLLFNSIYILVGVTFDGQNYRSLDTLNPNDKNLVEIAKQRAYNNVNDFKSIDETTLNCISPEASLGAVQPDAQEQVSQQINASIAQGQQETWPGSSQPFTSPSYIDGGLPDYQTCSDPLSDISEMPQNSYSDSELFSKLYIEGDSWHVNGSPFPTVQVGYSSQNYSSEIEFMNGGSPYTTWGPENGLFYCSDGAEFDSQSPFLNSAVDISSTVKPKAVWFKIRNALKLIISVRRYAAARRNEELFYYKY